MSLRSFQAGISSLPFEILLKTSVVSSITSINTAVFEIINTTTVFGIHCKISKSVQLQYCTIQLILYKSNHVQPTSLSLPLPYCRYLCLTVATSTSLSLSLPHPHYHYLIVATYHSNSLIFRQDFKHSIA